MCMSSSKPPISDRLIWLRKPARLVVCESVFSPKCDPRIVDAEWDRLRSLDSHLTDGPCWHVSAVSRNGHGGATIHVFETTYRVAAVRTTGIETGFVGLGVKGIAHWRGMWLIGRRATACATYADHWEFAPGGSVEPGEDPAIGIERELIEECAVGALSRPRPIALLFDSVVRNWEIVLEIEIASPPDAPPNWEYSTLRMIDGFDIPAPRSPCTASMIEVAKRINLARQPRL